MSESKGKEKEEENSEQGESSSDSKTDSKPVFVLYNTKTKKKEVFKPKDKGKVRMYVCGVTAYDYSHIGHARAYVAFDVLYRYLKYLGYEVVYVRNFTDVDDKIIKRANESGERAEDLSGRFCEEFLRDMDDLQCRRPTHQPRVSEHIVQIVEMIEEIKQNDCAYESGGDVYFEIDKFPNYGQLSARVQDSESNRPGERVAVDSKKKNPADFALWKAAKPGEPNWNSPWRPGRPGWHIECSAMSAFYLTHSFDIHGGGLDLIFPHHENELAQSCAAHPDSHISYWVHNGFVTIDDKKMSKSLGNFFTIREVTKHYHPLALRLFLLGMHYRSPVNYSLQQLDVASENLFYMYQTLKDVEDALKVHEDALKEFQENESSGKKASIDAEIEECISKLRSEFESKMADDLHASAILNGAVQESLRTMNKSLKKLKPKKLPKPQKISLAGSLFKLREEVAGVLDILGLLPNKGYAEVLEELKSRALTRGEMKEEEVVGIIEERKEARRNGEYARADEIRKKLEAKGISLMDDGMDTFWRPCVPVTVKNDVTENKESLQEAQPVEPVELVAVED